MGKQKYIIIDRQLEDGFITGDIKVVAGIIGCSHRTAERWFHGIRYLDRGRFIVVKKPYLANRKIRRNFSPEFLAKQFKRAE